MAIRIADKGKPKPAPKVKREKPEPKGSPKLASDLSRLIAMKPEKPVAPSGEVVKSRRPKGDERKVSVTLRIDPDVLAKFKAGGPGWQSRMNEALRKAKP